MVANTTALALLSDEMPVRPVAYDLSGKRAALLAVDPVKGFAAVGCGPLAPPVENPQVTRMVAEIDRLARAFVGAGLPVAAFLDTHEPGKPEFPYPPHCEVGSGQEDLVDELAWMGADAGVALFRKDCINGLVGGFDASGHNAVLAWIAANGIEALVVTGICTDICVMQFVQTLLSARNHGMVGASLADVVVYEPGCATYDLPLEVACAIGLPNTAAHPQDVAHHIGLYLMASSGAVIANALIGLPTA
jgi:nicotinamidase-related amidase